jgi:hypothetical protein
MLVPRAATTSPMADSRGQTHAVVDLRVATYNIHRCRGMDRRVRPERIAALLATINPDVAALQEVIGPGLTGPGHAEALGPPWVWDGRWRRPGNCGSTSSATSCSAASPSASTGALT